MRSVGCATERPFDGQPRSILRCWKQVGVHAQGEARVGMTQIVGYRSHGLAGIDEYGRVEVPQSMHAVLTRLLHTSSGERLLPHVRIEVAAIDGLVLPRREDQLGVL